MVILLIPWIDKKGKVSYLPIHSFVFWRLIYEKSEQCKNCPLHRKTGCIADKCIFEIAHQGD